MGNAYGAMFLKCSECGKFMMVHPDRGSRRRFREGKSVIVRSMFEPLNNGTCDYRRFELIADKPVLCMECEIKAMQPVEVQP